MGCFPMNAPHIIEEGNWMFGIYSLATCESVLETKRPKFVFEMYTARCWKDLENFEKLDDLVDRRKMNEIELHEK